MKRIPKWLRNLLLVVVGLILVSCVGTFVGSISIQGDSLPLRIGACIVAVAVWIFIIWLLQIKDELSNYQRRDEESYVFHFPRTTSGWITPDSVLAHLAQDYDLSDTEIENIVLSGIRNAAAEYRDEHPLDFYE